MGYRNIKYCKIEINGMKMIKMCIWDAIYLELDKPI